MFEFKIKGYLACKDPYYYSSKKEIEITVFAENITEALEKADSVIGYIHRETYTCTVREILEV